MGFALVIWTIPCIARMALCIILHGWCNHEAWSWMGHNRQSGFFLDGLCFKEAHTTNEKLPIDQMLRLMRCG